MIAHFVGGPLHGRDEAISSPQRQLRVPEAKGGFLGGWYEHIYEAARSVGNYTVYTWKPPRVTVNWEVALPLAFFDGAWGSVDYREFSPALIDKLSGETRESVQALDFDLDSNEIRVRGTVVVDGPPGPEAIAAATKLVQTRLDHVFPNVQIKRTSFGCED